MKEAIIEGGIMNTELLKLKDFGPLIPYIEDSNVTDINIRNGTVWIDDVEKGRYQSELRITAGFLEKLTDRIKNLAKSNFNPYEPVLEGGSDTLRISIIHESVSNSGRAVSIRKTPRNVRINEAKMLEENYCNREVLDFLINLVKCKANIVIAGTPGVGKTELLKFLTTYIYPLDQIATVEDTLEIHLGSILPDSFRLELKITKDFTYSMALKTLLRQLPDWILLSESRSEEIKYLLESLSNGTHAITTIHADDVRKIPDRMGNMAGDSLMSDKIKRDIYMFLDIGISIKKDILSDGKIRRHIDQIAVFYREDEGTDGDLFRNHMVMLVDEGKVINKNIPLSLKRKFKEYNVENPWECRRNDEEKKNILYVT